MNSYALAVSANSEAPDVAWSFIHFLTSDSDAYLERSGYVTGFKGWADTEASPSSPGDAAPVSPRR